MSRTEDNGGVDGEAPLLEVRELSVCFDTEEGGMTVLDAISFEVPRGATVALVGESGSGKTMTGHAIMRLLACPPAQVSAARCRLNGRELLSLSERHMRQVRGGEIGFIFQDPKAALNPVYPVGKQLMEAFRLHQRLSRAEAKRRSIALLARVGLQEPDRRFGEYAHQLSGGMRQRVMIAIALACDPPLVIADEPTASLDMLAAAQVMGLLSDLKRERSMAMLLISHDLAMLAEHAEWVVVLYAGQVVERGPMAELLASPAHPYTRALLGSVVPLRLRRRRRRRTPTRLPTFLGPVVDPRVVPEGCRFAPRCPEAVERCHHQRPELRPLAGALSHARCFLNEEPAPEREGSAAPLRAPNSEESSEDD